MVRDPKGSSPKPSRRGGHAGLQPPIDTEVADADGAPQRKAGYAQPPQRNQWKKGQSGNRSGRKKGSKNKRTIIVELMEEKLGRKIEDISKLSRYEGLLLKAIQKALGGDTKAMAFILRRYDDAAAMQSRAEPISTEQDEAVYAALVNKIKRELSEARQ